MDTLAESGAAALRNEIQAKYTEIKRRKERAVVERTQARQELQAITQDALAPAHVRESLEKFESLWPAFSSEEKREFVKLMIARIEVRSGEGQTDGRRDPRLIDLKIKLHLPALLEGAQDSIGSRRVRKGSRFVVDATVKLAAGTGDTVILAPFVHQVSKPKPRQKKRVTELSEELHPIHRALALEKKMTATGPLPLAAVAKEEGLSPATLCQLLKLTRLTEPVKTRLLALRGRSETWRCGIRQLLPLVGLEPRKQMQAFQKILTRPKAGKRRAGSVAEASGAFSS